MNKLIEIKSEEDLIPFKTYLKNMLGISAIDGVNRYQDFNEYLIIQKYQDKYELLVGGSVEGGVQGFSIYRTFEQLKNDFKIRIK